MSQTLSFESFIENNSRGTVFGYEDPGHRLVLYIIHI